MTAMNLGDPARLEGMIAVPMPNLPALSRRETEVLSIIAQGRTNREVATELDVSVHAVKFHLASIYRKLDVHNRTEAVVALFRSNQS